MAIPRLLNLPAIYKIVRYTKVFGVRVDALLSLVIRVSLLDVVSGMEISQQTEIRIQDHSNARETNSNNLSYLNTTI